jgi:hypothetical protein
MTMQTLFAGIPVTAWYHTVSDGAPLRAGVYQTTADPDYLETKNVLFRHYDGAMRWGPSDANPHRAEERAKKEGHLLTSPLFWRGASEPVEHIDAVALSMELYRRELATCTWGFPVPSKLSEVRKAAHALDNLKASQARLDPEGTLWNKYAPDAFKVTAPAPAPQTSRVRVKLIEDLPQQAELPLTAPRVRLIV